MASAPIECRLILRLAARLKQGLGNRALDDHSALGGVPKDLAMRVSDQAGTE